VFNGGDSQVVRSPKEFQFQDDAVEVRRKGDSLILILVPRSATRR
jgi:virulence-associated protein VagC